MSAMAVEGIVMNAARLRAWFKKARREFRVLRLPLLAPVQIGQALQRAEMPWLMAEYAADKKLEALRTHLHTCAQPDLEALRLVDECFRAQAEAEAHCSGMHTLMRLELDYLRGKCWPDVYAGKR